MAAKPKGTCRRCGKAVFLSVGNGDEGAELRPNRHRMAGGGGDCDGYLLQAKDIR